MRFCIYSFILLFVIVACKRTTEVSDVAQEDVPTEKPQNTPFLWESATVYFLLTDRFNNGDPKNDFSLGRKQDGSKLRSFMGGDIRGIIKKLDEGYFTKLGIDALWFTPPIEQISGYTDEGTGKTYAYHGYWPRDWTSIDPNYGSMEDLAELVKKAHEKGIRILFDVIINHTGPVTAVDTPWGDEWIRESPACTFKNAETTIPCTLVKNLPDIRTDSDADVAIPDFLKEKWKKEGRLEEEMKELDEFFARTGYPRAPKYYIIKWLIDYVRELGIDGFRVDTAKHIEAGIWAELYQEAQAALAGWKTQHPNEKLDENEFFMVGEVYGYSIRHGQDFPMGGGDTVNFFDNGFKSLINFSFRSDVEKDMETIFKAYSDSLHHGSLKGYSVMNYVSSHDDGHPFDAKREKAMEAGTKLLLAPGAAQVYYGDETARLLEVPGAEGDAHLRSMMNWESLAGDSTQNGVKIKEVFEHWAKLGKFRKAHLAVGAGVHEQISSSPYIFKRVLKTDAYEDAVVVAVDVPEPEINVSGVFQDGAVVKNYYSGEEVTVTNGKATFTNKANLYLIGKP